jgi:hypothetical protein
MNSDKKSNMNSDKKSNMNIDKKSNMNIDKKLVWKVLKILHLTCIVITLLALALLS